MRAILSANQRALADLASKFAGTMAVRTPSELSAIDVGEFWGELVAIGVMEARMERDAEARASVLDLSLFVEALGGVISPLPLLGNLAALELLRLVQAPDQLCDDIASGRTACALLMNPTLRSPGRIDEPGLVFDARCANLVVGLDAEGSVFIGELGDSPEVNGADLSRQLRNWSGVPGTLVGPAPDAETRQRWLAFVNVLICADIVGVLRVGLADVVEYARTRIQYGVPIGSFQAVQHMCAEMLVSIEGATSAMRYAAWAADELDPQAALLAAHVAKAWAASTGRNVTETLMQAYGGIGQTWEHVAHLRTRRVALDIALLGDDSVHLLAISRQRLSLLKGA